MSENALINSDGVFKVRRIAKGEQVLRVRSDMSGEYRRFTLDGGKKIVFVRV